MDFHETILNRRSIRRFTDSPVPEATILKLLEYASAAPSACNRKPWEFYVVTEEKFLSPLRKASRFTNYISPLNIVVCGNTRRSLPLQLSSYWIQDCSAAIENILLGATSLGLGAVWCGLLPQVRPQDRVRKILSLPEHIIPLALIHIGTPSEARPPHEGLDMKRVHFVKEGAPVEEDE
ncbi:MAG: nitroreductase family protein [Bacilli bacterium]|nr:nitroreductase family protein [Bacilli bacterium]